MAIELRIEKLIFSKEIDWYEVNSRETLFRDMMRNRVTVLGSVSTNAQKEPDFIHQEIFDDFMEQVRDYCNESNIGLFSMTTDTYKTNNGKRLVDYQDHIDRAYNGAAGKLTIYFEDEGDYARFLRDKLVMFRLSM